MKLQNFSKGEFITSVSFSCGLTVECIISLVYDPPLFKIIFVNFTNAITPTPHALFCQWSSSFLLYLILFSISEALDIFIYPPLAFFALGLSYSTLLHSLPPSLTELISFLFLFLSSKCNSSQVFCAFAFFFFKHWFRWLSQFIASALASLLNC